MTWGQFDASAPALARSLRLAFESHAHHVIATLRSDGSPRVGGTNVWFDVDQIWIGVMPEAARVTDLRRDPRCAIHSAPLDEKLSEGDARLELLAHEVRGSEARRLLGTSGNSDGGVVFVLDVRRASLVRVEGESLVLDIWTPTVGSRTRRISN